MHTKIDLDKKHIVILGGGYCGLRVAKRLAKKLEKYDDYQVILIDRNALHLYAVELYEIANTYYPNITRAGLQDLTESITIPFSQLLHDTQVCFIQDLILGVDSQKKTVKLFNGGEVKYEYLVVSLGSVTNYYGIPGVSEKALPLKTIDDALNLECHFDDLFRERFEKNDHSHFDVVIGGGGPTGVEYACQLPSYIAKLSAKYKFDPKEVTITIAQSGHELMGLGPDVSNMVQQRLQRFGVEALCDAHIIGYSFGKLDISRPDGTDKRQIYADILVWTAGVQPHPALKSFPVLHVSGCLDVGPNLEATHYPKVYVGGDDAAIFDMTHHQLLPKLGVLAVQHAPIIAHNIWADIAKKRQKTYKPRFKGYVISLGGRSYLYHKNGKNIVGILPWLKRRLFDLWYFYSILPLVKAIKKWWRTEKIIVKNN